MPGGISIQSMIGLPADGSIANAKLASMANGTIKGRTTAGTGAPEDLTPSQARTVLSLVPGTDVQAYNALLAALAGLTGANGSFVRFTGASTAVMQAINGSVAQSGGVATGALFEKGSNANGVYHKTAGGLMVCTGVAISGAADTANGSIFLASATTTWTFPAAFSAAPVPSFWPARTSGSGPAWASGLASTPSTTSVRFYATSSASSNVSDYTGSAVGAWF